MMAVRDDFAAGEVLAAADLNDTFGSKLDLAGGKILQIVRATDGTDRSTTSTSFVDASISVTISPQESDSAIILIYNYEGNSPSAAFCQTTITDSSNNSISGAELVQSGDIVSGNTFRATITAIAYATPATTSATTYKVRFRSSSGGTAAIANATKTGTLYAIEVSA